MSVAMRQAARPASDGLRPAALKPTSLNTPTAVEMIGVIFMDADQILEMNTPDEFFKNPQHERTKLFLSQILH